MKYVFILCAALIMACEAPVSPGVVEDPATREVSGDRDYLPLSLYRVEGSAARWAYDYTVPPVLHDWQDDRKLQGWMWDYTVDLIPPQDRPMISEFQVVFSEEIAGYVKPVNGSLSGWRLAMGINIPSIVSPPVLQGYYAYALIHEFGHLKTLNNGQISPGNSPCYGLRVSYGCALPGAYIEEFFEEFWKDIQQDFNAMGESAFYQKYRSQFVTSYAATHPLEDIAESFAHFVFTGFPSGNSVASEKLRFFYNYAELVRLRRDIRMRGVQEVAFRAAPEVKCGHEHGEFSYLLPAASN